MAAAGAEAAAVGAAPDLLLVPRALPPRHRLKRLLPLLLRPQGCAGWRLLRRRHLLGPQGCAGQHLLRRIPPLQQLLQLRPQGCAPQGCAGWRLLRRRHLLGLQGCVGWRQRCHRLLRLVRLQALQPAARSQGCLQGRLRQTCGSLQPQRRHQQPTAQQPIIPTTTSSTPHRTSCCCSASKSASRAASSAAAAAAAAAAASPCCRFHRSYLRSRSACEGGCARHAAPYYPSAGVNSQQPDNLSLHQQPPRARPITPRRPLLPPPPLPSQ